MPRFAGIAVGAALAAFAVASAQQQGAEPRALTQSELEQRIVDHVIHAPQMRHDDMGQMYCDGRWQTGGRVPSHGTYRVVDDQICILPGLIKALEICRQYFTDDEGALFQRSINPTNHETRFVEIEATRCE